MDAIGRLSFTPGPDMFGNASCTVRLTEQIPDGLSATASLYIVVKPGESTLRSVLDVPGWLKPKPLGCSACAAS
jgi:hypothetical protein